MFVVNEFVKQSLMFFQKEIHNVHHVYFCVISSKFYLQFFCENSDLLKRFLMKNFLNICKFLFEVFDLKSFD